MVKHSDNKIHAGMLGRPKLLPLKRRTLLVYTQARNILISIQTQRCLIGSMLGTN